MKAIVGLGNPGARYRPTRHNVGFQVVDLLAKDTLSHAFEFCTWFKALPDLVLVKPLTFMNNSGLAVAQVVQHFQIDIADILIIVDDIHLDVGRLRFRRNGSHGGHNGLRSIQSVLGSSDFPRVRMGIGSPADSDRLMDHVLGVFIPSEVDIIANATGQAAKGAICWATQGIELAMNQFNAR